MADPPETLETPIADEPQPARFNAQRLAIMLGGVLVLFALVWFFFLSGGGEEPPPENIPEVMPAATPTPEVTPDEKSPVETFEVFAARDPFEPLVGAGAGDGGDDTEGEPDDGSDTTDGTDGADGTDGSGGTDGAGGTGDGSGGESIGGHRVRVVDVFPRGGRAQVQVDGTVYTVDEGEQFAENFELVRADGRCATMLFGDDEFTLCEGEEILK